MKIFYVMVGFDLQEARARSMSDERGGSDPATLVSKAQLMGAAPYPGAWIQELG